MLLAATKSRIMAVCKKKFLGVSRGGFHPPKLMQQGPVAGDTPAVNCLSRIDVSLFFTDRCPELVRPTVSAKEAYKCRGTSGLQVL